MSRRCYCILYINSHVPFPVAGALLPRRIRRFELIDHESPIEVAAWRRRQANGFTAIERPPYRYFSVSSTNGRVTSRDPLDHVRWLLASFQPSFCLASLRADGANYGLSFWWGTQGGAGPVVMPELAVLLARHELPVDFELYHT